MNYDEEQKIILKISLIMRMHSKYKYHEIAEQIFRQIVSKEIQKVKDHYERLFFTSNDNSN